MTGFPALRIGYREHVQVVAIGDVGVLDDMIHIGDEAMFEQLVLQLRSRSVDRIVGLSANPRDTAARYGIDAIERIGFTGSRTDMLQRMSAVLEAARSATPAPDARAQAVIDAVFASDGVAIAGGGNMASNWPLHIFERATLGELARIAGVPLVVSGQTIGPTLGADDAALVAGLLSSARRVGLRESASAALCATLGLPAALTSQTVDDASFLHYDLPPTEPTCLVTLAHHIGDHDRDAMVSALARLLDGAANLGLSVVFSPHFGALVPGQPRGDSAMHESVRAAMRATSSVVEAEDAATSARLARAASLVISSRYHPVVFASSAGVPTIGIPVDEYTRVKLTGALGNFAQHGVLPAESLIAGSDLLDRTWAARDEIRATGLAAARSNRVASDAWWDAVRAEFSTN